ncbi:hypothetical protein M501DRAFT_975673 [Patellaria atrata CBS 101060]|uniref:Glutamyl-tRNA synthetase n=1 Tax=Patellaria atrata CBS 101060 TaxID=1346257 RepID=A0A9P4S9Z6_9PEZI|nr:hypothetical protein M501DRAFT_975673 [Patellaria atrata CBS 101060]
MQATQATSPQPPSPTRQSPFEKALTLIDTAHAQDPTPYHPPPSPSNPNPPPIPYELHYANRMTAHLSRRAPSASERLQLAVRAQHFRRWEVPRSEYPMTRTGYHAWRTYLKKRQKEMVVRVCVEAGLGGEAEGVGRLVGKEGLGGAEEEVRILEDVACLVFLDDQFEEFERGVEEEKMVGILRKTWGKMTARGRELALEIEMSERCRELAGKALAG